MTASLAIQDYNELDDTHCEARIRAAKQALGSRLAILGHHYQRDEVFQHADFSGDSLKLSRDAAQSDAEFIVLFGVHFMAEGADILSRPAQAVNLPVVVGGCFLADMASPANVARARREPGEGLPDPD